MSEHASSDVLARFVDDTLPAEERATLEDHLDGCDDCRAMVAMLVKAAVAERRASEPTLGTIPPIALQATEVATSSPGTARPGLPPGTTLGRYVIRETLGVGGMGVVYAAHDPDLHRDVAIKVLRSDLTRVDPDAPKRIIREAQAMAKLAHPNVVPVFDVGTVDGQVFIAMERVAGTSLREWLTGTTRSPADILEMFIEAGRGLVAAHDAGMVHRDFKPDNVLVGTDGRPRVTDFGLAFDQGDREATEISGDDKTRPIVGTPSYMAPEQHAGANLDARSDQFSFAVALFEALYGKRPFAGKTRDQLVDAVMNGRIEPPPPRSPVPSSLRAILVRALSVKPGDRFPTMAELLRALGRDRGRVPRQIGWLALVAFIVVAVGFTADWIMRERTHAVTRTSFAAARAQLDKLIALRTDEFAAKADAVYRLPIMLEIASSRDQADFGLGEESVDAAQLAHQHDTLCSADWVRLIKTDPADVLAIADHKGRLLFDSASVNRWGTSVMAVGAIATAYNAETETYLGVIDAAEPHVVESGLLGGVQQQKLYVAFARARRIGARPNAVFFQLVEAGHLLADVGVGVDKDTLLSVVSAEGVAAGKVPAAVLRAVGAEGIDELELDDGSWLAERTPLRAKGQAEAIAQLVLARQTDVGLSGLFPHARLTLGVLAALFAAIGIGGFMLAKRRELDRRRR